MDVTSRRMLWYSGFDKIPNFELHNDEGRSYLTRSHEKFDVIQATVVDTWAATAAGAMALTENSLYSLDGWRIFYEHLNPGGIIAFSRWNHKPDFHETTRLFSLAYATLLSEGVKDPETHLAMIRQDELATLLASNQPFTPQDLDKIRATSRDLDYQILYLPGEELGMQQLQPVLQAHTLAGLAALRSADYFDLSPPTDSSPYFFSFVRFHAIPGILRIPGVHWEVLLPLLHLTIFMLAALILVVLTIVWPARRWTRLQQGSAPAPGGRHPLLHRHRTGIHAGGNGHDATAFDLSWAADLFVGRGAGGIDSFRGVGQPGVGSNRHQFKLDQPRAGAAFRAGACWSIRWWFFLPFMEPWRESCGSALLVSLALVAPCGFIMGFCFPVGMRWATQLGQEGNLPWMWALNGAASVLASFIAMVISTESSIRACVLTGAACYALGGILLSGKSSSASTKPAMAGDAKPAAAR